MNTTFYIEHSKLGIYFGCLAFGMAIVTDSLGVSIILRPHHSYLCGCYPYGETKN